MNFNHGLTIGKGYSTYYIQDIFKHNRYRGMRHSLTTNTLVLISNHLESPYEDKWIDGILHYNGMGIIGDQKIDFMQNATLLKSRETGVELYLFEIFDNSTEKYIFMGQVELSGEPYVTMQYDKEGKYRQVWVFPLKPLNQYWNSLFIDDRLLKETENSNHKLNKVKKLSNTELRKRAENASITPGSRKATVNSFQRDIYVSEYTKKRANGFCELCKKTAPFKSKKGEPYLETHHIEWLSNGGEDSIRNTVALCPNCHRKMHSLNLQKDIQKLKDQIE